MPHLSKYKTTRQSGGTCEACKQPREKHCCKDYYRQRTIETIGYDEWLPNVRIAVSEEIPDDVLYDFIRRGAIEFAKKTTILRRNIELQLQDCVGDYYPCLGEPERIDQVRLLSINDRCYEAIGDTCTWDVGGYRYWFAPPHTLEIHPVPRKADCSKVILTVVGVPREDSTEVDRLIYDRHFDAIEHYAVAKAMQLPLPDEEKRKRVSMELMAWRTREFNQAVNKAKIDIARHYSNGGQTWSSHA